MNKSTPQPLAGSADPSVDAIAQEARRWHVQRAHRSWSAGLFDAAGTPQALWNLDWREYLWHSMSLLNGDKADVRRANTWLKRVAGSASGGNGHFWSSAVTSILARHGERLDVDLADRLRTRLGAMIEGESRQRFRGYNDNFPAMAALSTLVGGDVTEVTQYADGGLECLDSLQRLLSRRGALTEYCSPTYTAITLTCLAEIVELSTNPDAQRLARDAEHRVWADLASRFHPPTSFLAGPFSRAYTVDLCAHPHNAHAALYMAFGDAVFVNPATALFPPATRTVLHGDAPSFVAAHAAWHTTPTYHVPPEAVELAFHKPRTCVVRASSEQAAFPRNVWSSDPHPRTPLAEFPAGPVNTYSYLADDFAFGVSDRQFLDGAQSTPFHATFVRNAPARSIADIGTLFSRFVIDDKPFTRDRHVADEGRANALAHGPTALLLYRGRPAWGALATPDYATTGASSLKLSMVWSTPCGAGPNEVWIGDAPAAAWQGESKRPASVFVRDGSLFVALHPLTSVDYGRRAAVRLERSDDVAAVSFISYEGPPRPFTDVELLTCHTGVVVELSSAADWPGFAAFRAFHAAPQLRDTYHAADRMRSVRYARDGLELAMEISPVSDGIKSRSINGKAAPEPMFAVDGVDVSTLPWMT